MSNAKPRTKHQAPAALQSSVVLLKAMASHPRAHMLSLLMEEVGKEFSVRGIEREIGLAQSAVSQHLAILRKAGLVKTRRDQQTIYYSLADERVREVFDLLSHPGPRSSEQASQ